jgi:hypothetical protein
VYESWIFFKSCRDYSTKFNGRLRTFRMNFVRTHHVRSKAYYDQQPQILLSRVLVSVSSRKPAEKKLLPRGPGSGSLPPPDHRLFFCLSRSCEGILHHGRHQATHEGNVPVKCPFLPLQQGIGPQPPSAFAGRYGTINIDSLIQCVPRDNPPLPKTGLWVLFLLNCRWAWGTSGITNDLLRKQHLNYGPSICNR